MIKLKESEKIELWAVTAVMTLALIFSIVQAVSNHFVAPPSYYENNFWIRLLFNYLITCVCYLLLFFYVAPELKKTEKPVSNAIFFVYFLIAACFFLDIINVYFAVLLAIKILIIYVTSSRQNLKNQFANEFTMLFACWMFMFAGVCLLNTNLIVITCTAFIIPIAILHYLYAMYTLLPAIMAKKHRFLRYIGTTFLLALLSLAPLGLLLYLSVYENRVLLIFQNAYGYNGNHLTEVIMPLNFPVQFILVPLFAWNIYKARNENKAEEIITLKTELGKSDANLNFLKSQINPHFLFNALNTLYGTALQENAERTGEGIQKLGDMMRFMLQENMEDKILLSRDVDYLNNYIALQKLRTSTSSDVTIETQIEEQYGDLQISPMLLIPFVENAFKHGISLLNPSHIKITLQTAEETLYFDVHNSLHVKKENDPERLQSGIGLQNVKQRLALLYPGKHELIIRESAREFFIHLTIKLGTNV